LRKRAKEAGLPLVYLNQVGGQDELVFDGASLALDAKGELRLQAPAFAEGLFAFDFSRGALESEVKQAPPGELESIYQALVLGLRDYVNKNGFKGVVLGLSGGIDSALTLAIAVDALGAERVEA